MFPVATLDFGSSASLLGSLDEEGSLADTVDEGRLGDVWSELLAASDGGSESLLELSGGVGRVGEVRLFEEGVASEGGAGDFLQGLGGEFDEEAAPDPGGGGIVDDVAMYRSAMLIPTVLQS